MQNDRPRTSAYEAGGILGTVIGLAEQHPMLATVTAAAAALLLLLAFVTVRRILRAVNRFRKRVGDEDVLTVITAGIATAVAGQGMWAFFEALRIPVWLRILCFAFLELMVITSALRARSSMRADHGAGVDGVAMWALTGLSAVLAATHAASFGELLLRLSAPLVAAWGWHRGMKLERRERTGQTGLNWRVSPERILVRLGLADPTDRTASEVDAQRRLMRLALAVQHARTTRPGIKDWRRKRATKRLNRAMEGAVEYGGLGTDPDSADTLLAVLGTLINASDLVDLQTPAPWHRQVPIPDTPSAASVPSGHSALEAPGDAPAVVDLGHAERALSVVSGAGQPKVQGLDWAIWIAKASGMSVRDIAAAYEITKYRVEKALSSDSRTATADTAPELSQISAADLLEGIRSEPVRHTDNGQAQASAAGDQA